jgi:hypothetical protein
MIDGNCCATVPKQPAVVCAFNQHNTNVKMPGVIERNWSELLEAGTVFYGAILLHRKRVSIHRILRHVTRHNTVVAVE